MWTNCLINKNKLKVVGAFNCLENQVALTQFISDGQK